MRKLNIEIQKHKDKAEQEAKRRAELELELEKAGEKAAGDLFRRNSNDTARENEALLRELHNLREENARIRETLA